MSLKVSVITPTAERAHRLQGAYRLLQQQSHTNWEWLIYDTSLRPSAFNDDRVQYVHDQGIVSIGEKRNRLLDKVKGDIIVHFDDDDFYAPYYLQHVAAQLEKRPFFTLSSWFSYDTKTGQFYYWDTNQEMSSHYILSPLGGAKIHEVCTSQNKNLNAHAKIGYGFSYAYQRDVIKKCRFPDVDFGEDRVFYVSALSAGFEPDVRPDLNGMVVHVIHDSNTSTEYPQYRIPRFLVEPLIPSFFSYLESVHEN